MDKTNREFLLSHGYEEVSNIKNVIRHGKVKNLHIEVYKNNPSMLLARVKEKDAVINTDDICKNEESMIITQSDKFRTYIFNVPLALIKNVLMETGRNITTILFNVQGDDYTYKLCYRN